MSRFGRFEGMTILGAGQALPERRIDNQALIELVGATQSLTPEGLRKLSGVETRHWAHAIGAPADHSETTSQDLAIEAARRALEDARVAPGEIGGILMVTTTAPRPSVNTGNHIAKALGIGGFALELKAGCSSSVYGLVVAASMMGLGAESILLVAAETWTKLTPPGLPGPMAVAGDGAAALVLGRGSGAFLGGALWTRPEHAAAMMPPGLYPPTPEAIERNDYQIKLTEDVSELVRDCYPLVYQEALSAAGLAGHEVDLVIPHQASAPILRRALRDCGVSEDRAYHTLSRYGNASSASVLLSLHDARREGRLKSGENVALVSVGGGVTAASVVLRV